MRRNGIDTKGEPLIEEILADPIVHLLMKGDGLSVDAVRHFIQKQRIRLLEARLTARITGEAA